MNKTIGWITALGLGIGATVVARADGLLPDGWVRGESQIAGAEPPRSTARQARRAPFEIDVDRLPLGVTDVQAASELGVYDERGRPHPRPLARMPGDSRVRLTPPGRAGFVRMGEGDALVAAPFFSDRTKARDLGFGPEYTFGASVPNDQPLYWHSLDLDVGGLRLRSARGRFDRATGATTVIEWVDARPVDVAEGVVFAYRTTRGTEEVIGFVMPASFPVFDDGAHRVEPNALGSFFSRDAFTLVELRVEEGQAASAGVRITSSLSDRWEAAGGPRTTFDGAVVLSVSRASGDRKATVMVALSD